MTITINPQTVEPFDQITIGENIFALVPVESFPNSCAHPESAIYPLQWLPDMGICETCGAVVRFVGVEEGWVKCPPAEFEAIIYQEVIEPADDALSSVASALYDARDFQEKAECISSYNEVLKQERAERHQRIMKAIAR